jgi:hypothetical protein
VDSDLVDGAADELDDAGLHERSWTRTGTISDEHKIEEAIEAGRWRGEIGDELQLGCFVAPSSGAPGMEAMRNGDGSAGVLPGYGGG